MSEDPSDSLHPSEELNGLCKFNFTFSQYARVAIGGRRKK
jgi:hypothetical protein